MGDSGFFQSHLYDLLFLERKYNLSASSLERLVASEVTDEQRHELVILLRVHLVQDVHEVLGKPHRLVFRYAATTHLRGFYDYS